MFRFLNKWLEGKPDATIRIVLLVLSTIGYVVAFVGTPSLRLFVTAYFLFP